MNANLNALGLVPMWAGLARAGTGCHPVHRQHYRFLEARGPVMRIFTFQCTTCTNPCQLVVKSGAELSKDVPLWGKCPIWKTEHKATWRCLRSKPMCERRSKS